MKSLGMLVDVAEEAHLLHSKIMGSGFMHNCIPVHIIRVKQSNGGSWGNTNSVHILSPQSDSKLYDSEHHKET